MPHSVKSLAAVLASAMLGLFAFSATAFALHIVGTNGNDRIRGSMKADGIDARAGNDRVFARGGKDTEDTG